ncbi:MAG: hypothetical protein ACOVO1_10325 [Chitinophagaceae bacterium]
MINNSNHIDNWLQQSAAMGDAPFVNADWLAMQKMLEEKRKRKLMFFWFVILGLAILGLFVFFAINNHYKTSKNHVKDLNNNVANSVAINKNNLENKGHHTVPKIIDSSNKKEITNNIAIPIKVNEAKGFTTPQSNFANNDFAVTPKNISAKIKFIPLKSDELIYQQNSINNNNINSESFNRNNATNKAKKTQQKTTSSDVDNLLNKVNSISRNVYTPEIKYMHNRYIDSLKMFVIEYDSAAAINSLKQTAKTDSIVKDVNKKTIKQSSYIELSAGVALLNIANEMQTGLVKLNYAIPIAKKVYIDISSKAFLFNIDQSQTHKNIISISQTAGTILTRVDSRETIFLINKGVGIEPSFGLHYQLNKVSVGGAINYGFVINKPNITISTADTSTFYFGIPANIKVNNSYSDKDFVGKSFATISLNCAYSFTKKWNIQAIYAYLLKYNRVEGMLDNDRRRNSFYFAIGYRL